MPVAPHRYASAPLAPAPTVILGAGLAGLSCAYHLTSSACVFEAGSTVGGSARSVRRGGYTFDITGHWLHFKDPAMRTFVEDLMGDSFIEVHRRAGVYSHGVHTPYPFQAHTFGLPAHVIAECVLGYFNAQLARAQNVAQPCHSFEDYIRACMGDGIADHFMIPYNTKLWTVHPREMAHAWCGRFVPIPKAADVVWGALVQGGTGQDLGYNASFLYPRRGGIGQLASRICDVVTHPVHLGYKACHVDPARRVVTFDNGAQASYQTLVSTLPLTHLLALMSDVPGDVRQSVAKLRANQITWWDIGLRRPTPKDANHWTYFPGADIPFFRVGCPSAVWPDLAPENCTSYYVEVAHGPGTPCPVSDAQMLAGLRTVGLLGPDESPELCAKSHLDCAYTIMDHAYGAARQTVLGWLETQGIISTGRFGAWIYDSMEGALVAGRTAALRITAAMKGA